MAGANENARRILEGAEETLAYGRGEADQGAYRVHVPPRVDATRIRKKTGLSQAAFAARYGLSLGAVRDWEQNRSEPDTASRIVLAVIDKRPELLIEVLGGPA